MSTTPTAALRLAALTAVLALLAGACGPVVHLESGDPVSFVSQPQTSRVLARDGTVLAELHAEQDRRTVALDDVSDRLVDAVVATEDRRFFLHAGVDGPAILRAAVTNLQQGRVEQGGSTLTQQYVKNTMTGPARTLDRKLREAALALQLEQRYSKDQILERYLNTIYLGHGAYGVGAAAERYFGTGPATLSLPRAALLAGLIASPARFDPHRHPDAARSRRAHVLEAMVDTGAITPEQADEAAAAPLGVAELQPAGRWRAPYAVQEVLRRVRRDPAGRFGPVGRSEDERADALFTGGLRIHTTIDPGVQRRAARAVDDVLPGGGPSAAVVVTDPSSGAVRALVGGRDFYGGGGAARFNLATQGRRQPGSSFKPIVLATALSRGVELTRRFPGGTCVSFPRAGPGNRPWEPCNYADTSYGPVDLREATVRSVNTVFARLGVELGPTPILQTAVELGLPTDLPRVPSIALGTATASPLEMAGAYGAFATLGSYTPPRLIERIETADGEVLWEADPQPEQVLDESVAYLVTQTLQDVVRRGTGVRARIDRPQAGKTGTSQDNADAWFIGYTPDLVGAVWVGFPRGRVPMRPPETPEVVEGGRWPARIWQQVVQGALRGRPAAEFPTPAVDVVTVEVDASRNCLPNPYTPEDLVESREFLRGTEPTEQCEQPTGPSTGEVPSVTRLPVEVARRLLADGGFAVEVRREPSGLYPPGVVLRQRPAPGERATPSPTDPATGGDTPTGGDATATPGPGADTAGRVVLWVSSATDPRPSVTASRPAGAGGTG